MERDESAPITELLHRHRGNRAAFDELVSLAYHRLRRIARGQLARAVVECRYFGGMTEEETAGALGI